MFNMRGASIGDEMVYFGIHVEQRPYLCQCESWRPQKSGGICGVPFLEWMYWLSLIWRFAWASGSSLIIRTGTSVVAVADPACGLV